MRKQAARGSLDAGARRDPSGGWRTIISSPASASGDDRHGAADAPGAADRRRADYRPTYRCRRKLQLLRELKQELNMGLLFITHNLSIVRQLADRVAVMQNGRCVEHNDCRALFSAPAHPTRLLDSEPDGEPVPLAADARCCCRRTI